MSRAAKSLKNVKYALLGQALSLVLSFINRTFFIRTLGAGYLGLNGLFTNLLEVLSLTELGISEAIVFSLYQPLRDSNHDRILALLRLYRRAFRLLALLVLIMGVVALPFLPYILPATANAANTSLIWLLYIANSIASYSFAYRRSLLVADQKRYVVSIFASLCHLGRVFLQVFVLLRFHSYMAYLVIQIAFSLLENVLLSWRAGKTFPYLKSKSQVSDLAKYEKVRILQEVKALFSHKLGGVLVIASDNILISKLLGLAQVGIYSNYLMIIKVLNMFFYLAFQSLVAGIGGLLAGQAREDRSLTGLEVFNKMNFFTSLSYGLVGLAIANSLNIFMELWLGTEYCLSAWLTVLLAFNFYLLGMRQPVRVFRNAYGIYRQDRHKPALEFIVNLVTSYILGKVWGLSGILLGTTIGQVSICLWWEPLVLFQAGFRSDVKSYYRKFLHYLVVFCSSLLASNWATRALPLTGWVRLPATAALSISTYLLVLLAYLYLLPHSREADMLRQLWESARIKLNR